MFKNLLSKVGWGELPSSFGFSVGEKVELPFQWSWELHKGQKKSDGSQVSIFVCGKKDLDSAQVAAAKNAEQMGKALRHPNILRALDSIEVEGGFYLVTEAAVPLLSVEVAEGEDGEPDVWGLYQTFDALSFLHQSGFTHGLFGPLSVFVTPQGDYRLGGFELCRKGADATSLLAARRRSGPTMVGFPDPPSALAEGGAPTQAVDFWGAAVMAAYVFGSARSGRRGPNAKIDMSRLAQDLPPDLRKPFAELQRYGPVRGRSPIAELIGLQYFEQHPCVRVMSFLGSLHIKSPEQKDAFFEGLPSLLDSVPQVVQTKQVLPELLTAQKFPGQEGAQVLPAILKIGTRLKDDEFKEKVAPLVVQLFTSPDRAIRFRLLTSLGEMISLLDDAMINDKIFPECVNGFTDSSGPIREATVKALVHFVPRLKAKTVETRVVKLLTKLLQDPEPSIRTNAVICCGRVSGHLPKESANQALGSVLAAGLKDSFGPCRSASMHTLLATASVFSAEELAGRLMPSVCQRLVDPDPGVSDAAFHVLGSLQEHVRQLVDERRSAQSAEAALIHGGGQAPPASGQPEATQQGGWGSWAFSTVGSVVGQKIIGSMGPAKRESTASDTTTAAAPTPAASQAPAAPAASAAASSGANRGMSLASRAPAAAPAPSQQVESALDLDDADQGGAAASGWGEEDFWDDFGDMPPPQDDSSTADGASPAPAAASSGGARDRASTAPAGQTIGGGGIVLGGHRTPGAAAKPKAQPKPEPAKKVATILDNDDEDFWKEFDM
mmetsp:Transcript_112510/g.359322  ORF Transcript_112510/g.359322 Transcript_112510/m.359322 type:complete len:778 (-) Transcript_112510:105-2438(-)